GLRPGLDFSGLLIAAVIEIVGRQVQFVVEQHIADAVGAEGVDSGDGFAVGRPCLGVVVLCVCAIRLQRRLGPFQRSVFFFPPPTTHRGPAAVAVGGGRGRGADASYPPRRSSAWAVVRSSRDRQIKREGEPLGPPLCGQNGI